MTPRSGRSVALSKALARALRHAPAAYHLELDDEGWVPVEQLVAGLRSVPRWRELSRVELVAVIDQSPKQRFELRGNRIRALYGHSVPTAIRREPAEPPAVLFHGTSRSALPDIQAQGLLPMRRQFVHLSVDRDSALVVARRKGSDPVVLVVSAAEAHQAGIEFLRGNEAVWLVDHLPSYFLTPATVP